MQEIINALLLEQVDNPDLGSGALQRKSSSLLEGTGENI